MQKIRHILILFIIFISVVAVRAYFLFSRKYSPRQTIRITERLAEQPYQTESSQIFHLAGFKIVARKFPAYSYGDRLVVVGQLKRKNSAVASGLLSGLPQNFLLVYPDISLVKADEMAAGSRVSIWLSLAKGLAGLRGRLVSLYRQLLPEPHASLLAGIVLGQKSTMPENFYTSLRQTGTLHIIVASGMNVAIFSGVIVWFLVRLISRRKAVMLAVAVVGFYVMLAGASAPVVRAGIMGTITYLAVFLGREKDGTIALLVTAGLMLLWNPVYFWDVGWELSFAATAGILYLFPILERYILTYLSWLPLQLEQELGVTLAAQLATWPIIAWHFGSLSLISPLANMLVGPVVPVVMAGGGVLVLVGLVSKLPATIIAWGVWPFLEYFVRVINGLGQPAGGLGQVDVSRISLFWIIGYYCGFSWLIYQLNRVSDNRQQ